MHAKGQTQFYCFIELASSAQRCQHSKEALNLKQQQQLTFPVCVLERVKKTKCSKITTRPSGQCVHNQHSITLDVCSQQEVFRLRLKPVLHASAGRLSCSVRASFYLAMNWRLASVNNRDGSACRLCCITFPNLQSLNGALPLCLRLRAPMHVAHKPLALRNPLTINEVLT